MTLRMRTVVGVTSTHSSSPANSRDSSRVSLRGGTRFSKESEEAARMFVSFFSLVMFTSMSSWRAFSPTTWPRSEEHTSELQSRGHLVCRLLLEKKKKKQQMPTHT